MSCYKWSMKSKENNSLTESNGVGMTLLGRTIAYLVLVTADTYIFEIAWYFIPLTQKWHRQNTRISKNFATISLKLNVAIEIATKKPPFFSLLANYTTTTLPKYWLPLRLIIKSKDINITIRDSIKVKVLHSHTKINFTQMALTSVIDKILYQLH